MFKDEVSGCVVFARPNLSLVTVDLETHLLVKVSGEGQGRAEKVPATCSCDSNRAIIHVGPSLDYRIDLLDRF